MKSDFSKIIAKAKPLPKAKKVKKKTDAQYKKILWTYFSKFIRNRDKGVCFTCGATGLSGHNYHAGHFVPKSVGGLALAFNEENVHGQCYKCNMMLSGNLYIYGKKLGAKAEELYAMKQQVVKNYPFQEKIAYYKNLVKE